LKLLKVSVLVFLIASTSNAMACASCGCSLSSDLISGYSSSEGWRLTVDYTLINQNQLRNGSNRVSPGSLVGTDQEIEHKTINRYTNIGLTYTINPDWNLKWMIPYVDRTHSTFGVGNLTSPDNLSAVSAAGLGDIKLLANYQGFLPTHNLGIQFGIKLPTGDYGGEASNGSKVGSHPKTFSSGPMAGELLDTSLNPGTGSTDLMLGIYYYRALSENLDGYMNAQYQTAVSEKLDAPGADYRPGNLASVNLGIRYEGFEKVTPQFQINVAHRTHDQGYLADTANTAGTTIYLSPGLTAKLSSKVDVYGFAQLPIYSRLDGYQLLPRWTATLGLSYQF
jgi:hypothetical protein